MANTRSKKSNSVPSKKAGRYRPPPLQQPEGKQRKKVMMVDANGKKRMV
jgi:hypothetical protein